MEDDNRQDVEEVVEDKTEEVVEDKKERWMRALRVAAYVAVALVAALSLLLMMVGTNAVVTFEGVTWLGMILELLMPVITAVLIVLALMSIKKDVSRLLMLFGGSVMFYGAYMVALGWTLGLISCVAGLAVFILVGVRQSRLHKDEPREKVKGKMLIISAVLAILNGIVQIGYAMLLAMLLAGYYGRSDLATAYFFVGLISAAGSFTLAATCFMKNRKTSVYYRMFFLGSLVVLATQMTSNIITALQVVGLSIAGYAYLAGNAAALAALVLVIVHALRTRKKTAEIEAEADAGEAEEEEEAEDDEGSTIGLYHEDDDEDSTIGLYHEDEAADKDAADEASEDGEPKDEDK